MTRVLAWTSAVALIGVLLLGGGQPAPAQDAKPTETTGVSVDTTSLQPLTPQIPGFDGYVLRLRRVTMEPGAVIAHHSHGERPTAVYVVSGELTEHRDDGQVITYRTGEQWVEGGDVSHWAENGGNVPSVLIVADIVPKP